MVLLKNTCICCCCLFLYKLLSNITYILVYEVHSFRHQLLGVCVVCNWFFLPFICFVLSFLKSVPPKGMPIIYPSWSHVFLFFFDIQSRFLHCSAVLRYVVFFFNSFRRGLMTESTKKERSEARKENVAVLPKCQSLPLSSLPQPLKFSTIVGTFLFFFVNRLEIFLIVVKIFCFSNVCPLLFLCNYVNALLFWAWDFIPWLFMGTLVLYIC